MTPPAARPPAAHLASPLAAAFVSVIVSYSGTFVLIFQAAQAGQLSMQQMGSWIWAMGLGIGFTGIWLSLRYRAPVITAWSTPGIAFLATVLPFAPYSEVIGAYVLSALGFMALGLSGAFERIVRWIPGGLAAGLLAGILLPFGIQAFGSASTEPLLVGALVLSYAILRRYTARYAVVGMLATGVVLLWLQQRVDMSGFTLSLAQPVLTLPSFSLASAVGIALPLFIVTLTGQYVPGMLVLRHDGYRTSASPILTVTGLGSLLAAPLGSHPVNLAAISAALCTGPDAHPDPSRRYIAGVAAGVMNIVIGLFGLTLAALFTRLPGGFVAALAGLALMGTIGGSLATALANPHTRDTALITFLATAANVTLLGMGGAFWGLVVGLLCHLIVHGGKRTLV